MEFYKQRDKMEENKFQEGQIIEVLGKVDYTEFKCVTVKILAKKVLVPHPQDYQCLRYWL